MRTSRWRTPISARLSVHWRQLPMNQNPYYRHFFFRSPLGRSIGMRMRAELKKRNQASTQSEAPTPRLRVKAEVAKEGTLSLDSLRTGTTQASHRMQLVAKSAEHSIVDWSTAVIASVPISSCLISMIGCQASIYGELLPASMVQRVI